MLKKLKLKELGIALGCTAAFCACGLLAAAAFVCAIGIGMLTWVIRNIRSLSVAALTLVAAAAVGRFAGFW